MVDILHQRLCRHGLCGTEVQSPHDVVQRLLCMQAQDRNQHLWAIASRTHGSRSDILQAYNDGFIVRTRTQRGTIHVVSAEDAGWMVQLCASKTLRGFSKRREHLGISDEVLEKSLELLQKYLYTGPKLRKDIAAMLTEGGIVLQSGWVYHLLCYAGTLGITVQGPILDGEQAFILTDQRIHQPKRYTDEEALRELCLRYFTSHGPATIDDLQRWSGLGKTQIKQGIVLCGDLLHEVTIDDRSYYIGELPVVTHSPQRVHFLAGFDEWLLGYKDRTATLSPEHHTGVDVSRNGIFKPTVMIDGKTIGIRSVKHKSKVTEIVVQTFEKCLNEERKLLSAVPERYQDYLGKDVMIHVL